MRPIEEGFYKYLLQNITSIYSRLERALNDDCSGHSADEKAQLLNGLQFSQAQKESILTVFRYYLESITLRNLRALEGEYSSADGVDIDRDAYMDLHPEWHGGLVSVVDVFGKPLSEGQMYDNFISYLGENSGDKSK